MLDVFKKTFCSQYANSPIITQLVQNMNDYIDPRKSLLDFYNLVWNVDTAVGFGLDIWGRIVGVSRVIPIPAALGSFGFQTDNFPPDWQNFGVAGQSATGGPFYSGQVNTGGFTLNDDAFRVLILTKALANIVATNAPSLNALVRNLFPGRGRAYTLDGGKSNTSVGGMRMTYVFEFKLTTIEFAILSFSGVLPTPAGVGVNVIVVPSGFFGFRESGNRQHGFRETGVAGAFYVVPNVS